MLNPKEDYKSSVLSGLRPDLILEIAGRALSFWTYQSAQEICFQEANAKSLHEKCKDLERHAQNVMREAEQELQAYEEKLNGTKILLENEKKKNYELNEEFSEKCRQLQKLQALYDKMKRKELIQLSSQSQRADSSQGTHISGNPQYVLNQPAESHVGGIMRHIRTQENNSSRQPFSALPRRDSFKLNAQLEVPKESEKGYQEVKGLSGVNSSFTQRVPLQNRQNSTPDIDNRRSPKENTEKSNDGVVVPGSGLFKFNFSNQKLF